MTFQAVSYYEDALSLASEDALELKYDLAELYYKLKQYENAQKIVESALRMEQSIVYDVLANSLKRTR